MKELSWSERGKLWLRIGLRLLLLLLALWALVRLGPPLVSLFAPFLLAFFVAWALSPAVGKLHAHFRISRKFLSLALILLVFIALGAMLWALTAGVAGEIASLAGDWTSLMASLQAGAEAVDALFSRLMTHIPAAAQDAVRSMAEQFFLWLENVFPRLLSGALDWLTGVAKRVPSFAVSTVVFVMASYFLTADFSRLRAALRDKLPDGPRSFLSLVRQAVSAGFGGYVKAELILSVGVFFILLGGFLLIHQPYALLLALALAVLDFIPIIGSGTAMVPWAAVDLLLGDFRHAVGLLVVWGLVALFRRLAEPKVLGDQTGLSPILSLVSVYVGMKAAGVMGMVLGPVLCLVVLNICRSGVLDRSLADLRLAYRDLSAVLSGGDRSAS